MKKIETYHLLPSPIRTVAASAWGYYLHWWRYGKKTEFHLEEALERDNWKKEQWSNYNESRLSEILESAAKHVPYYKDIWNMRRRNGDKSSWQYLENWPILEKKEVRENPKKFISENAKKPLYIDHTSGTTGKPTLIYLNRETIIKWYAIFEARIRHWNNLSYKENWGIFGGQKIIPLNQTEPPFWVLNKGLNQVYFSIFHITLDSIKFYIDAINQHGLTHLIVYPSIFALFSKQIKDLGMDPPKLKAIILNAEKTWPQQKKLIAEVFSCKVIDTYGMAEIAAASSECDHGTMHYWPETGVIEILDHESREINKNLKNGPLVLTGLLNKDMPLIRYINGDIGSVPNWDQDCDCGKTLPVFEGVFGREKDLLKTNDGRSLYILDSLFNDLPIIEGQLVQEKIDSFLVNVIPNNNFKYDEVKKIIYSRIFHYFGEVDIILNKVSNLEINENGKVKSFISKVI